MKVLFVSNLFPSSVEPARGVFNFHQMRHLARCCDVRVVAPVAWFFNVSGKFAPPAPVPEREELDGLTVYHPKSFYLPKVGRTLNPSLYAMSLRGILENIYKEFPFEIIFVNWTYPDACGIAKIARQLSVPFVVSVSGSDANQYMQYRVRRWQILGMFHEARAITVRSRALKQLIMDYGVPAEKIHVVYNGVDLHQYAHIPREEARRRLNIPADEKLALYIGRLSPEKGVADLLRSLALLRRFFKIPVRLMTVGDGPQRGALLRQARALDVSDAVTWAGWKLPTEIYEYMCAADLLCLPSHSEGVPNAALEAFACGLPVAGTLVGGIPEIMTEEVGVLSPPHKPGSFAAAMREGLRRPWDTSKIRAHASRFDWTENAKHMSLILSGEIDPSSPGDAPRKPQTTSVVVRTTND